mmetsp:Transcript_13376/g.25677  ORF Transcript_13376/g.25677 Transcript_13376/m.25677 type:complete len:303 (+) Transcript_13376:503-1411(+)
MQYQHRRGHFAETAWLFEHDESGHGALDAVVQRVARYQAKSLVHSDDVPGSHWRAVAEVGIISSHVGLCKRHAVGAHGAEGRGGSVRLGEPSSCCTHAIGARGALLVARGHLFNHQPGGKLALPGHLLGEGDLGAGTVHPNRGHFIREGPRREHWRQLARVEGRDIERRALGVVVAPQVWPHVLHLETQVVLRLQKVGRAHRPVQLAALALQVAVLKEDAPAGANGNQVRSTLGARGDTPLQLHLCSFQRPLFQHNVHSNFLGVVVIRLWHNLYIVEELEQEDISQRPLGVLHIVQRPHSKW